MASKQSTCWVIEHPEIGTAFVVADSWEQATVRAAEFWGVSWARTVSGMELVRQGRAEEHLLPLRTDLPRERGSVRRVREDPADGGGRDEPPTAGDLVSGEKRRRLRAVKLTKEENEDDRREEPDAGDEGIVARGRL